MAKRTHFSVTEEPCTCRFLERCSDDDSKPILFDESTCEFQLHYGIGSYMVLHHCPLCGGATPESKRHLLFAKISDAEHRRLGHMLRGIRTISDAITQLGAPDRESFATLSSDEQNGGPPEVKHCRQFTYTRISDTVNIVIGEKPDGTIGWGLQGKYVGPKSEQSDS